MRDINPSHSCHKEASKWPATSNSEGQCSQSSTRKSRQKRPGLYKRNWPESKYAKLNGTVGRSVRTYMGWLRLHQVKARCQLTTTQQLHQIMKCKRFKVRKYTTAMMASTQLYSHRKNLRLWWGGEKFAKDPEEREKKKIRRPAMNDNGKMEPAWWRSKIGIHPEFGSSKKRRKKGLNYCQKSNMHKELSALNQKCRRMLL